MRLFTFWSFAPLTYLERLCLQSMLAAGHPVDLYTYDDNDLGAPGGVTIRDASEILPRSHPAWRLVGKPALFANLFRYAGLERGVGLWVDADVLLLRSLSDLKDAFVFGRQDAATINNAVLRLPPDCPYFATVNHVLRAQVPMPPHWRLERKVKQALRALVGRHRPLQELEWGVLGPKSLTHYVLKSGLAHLAQPKDVFFPIHWQQAQDLFRSDVIVEDRFSERTKAVHLWNNMVRDHKLRPPPTSSFLARMCERYGVET